MRRFLTLLVALAALLAPSAAQATMLGEQRVLVIPVTWGPEPFPVDAMSRTVFDEASAWYLDASYGQAWLTGDIAPWQHAFSSRPECNDRLIARTGREAAARAGFNVASYARFVFILPRIDCPFTGLGSGENAFLNGALSRFLIVHELGHTYGLPHSNTWDCPGGGCRATEYGNPYAVMGSGEGHYTAWDKVQLGWLPHVTDVKTTGDYELHRLEVKTVSPQALKITTARNEYWLEYRGPTQPRFGQPLPGGVLVNAGGNPFASLDMIPEYTAYNLLLPDPAGSGRAALTAGERFTERGSFDLSVSAAEDGLARVSFAWTDTTRPGLARPATPVPSGRQLEISWSEPKESGSGVQRYEVFLDKKRVAAVELEETLGTNAFVRRPAKGTHIVGVVAIDRAGNRSRTATRRFVLK